MGTAVTLVLGPLAGGDPGDMGQFLGFLAADEDAVFAVSPCVERRSLPYRFGVVCSDFVPSGEPYQSVQIQNNPRRVEKPRFF